MANTAIDTIPPRISIAHGETRPITINFTNQMKVGDVVVAPVIVTATRMDSGNAADNIVAAGSVGVATPLVALTIDGNELIAGVSYRVVVIPVLTAATGGTGAAALVIDCQT